MQVAGSATRDFLRHNLCRRLARGPCRAYQWHGSGGRLVPMPPALWSLIPQRVRKWLTHYVILPGEAGIYQCIRAHGSLAHLGREPLNEWMLAPSKLLFLWQTCAKLRPRRILEFGSGRSTLLFAAYARHAQNQGEEVRVCTLEHDRDWKDTTENWVREYAGLEHVSILHAPLAPQQILGTSRVTYSTPTAVLEEIGGRTGFDLCLIDGPPESVGRFASLPIAIPFLSSRAVILVDDCFRPQEREALRAWGETWASLGKPQFFLGGLHGIASATWHSRSPLSSGLPRGTA